jgi:muramoyltetrapeptide carboxypeptidase
MTGDIIVITKKLLTISFVSAFLTFSTFIQAKKAEPIKTAPITQQPELILPEQLHVGDTVALVSSGFRAPENIIVEYAKERLEALGLHVKYGKSIFAYNAYFAGTDQERAQDINSMFADPTVKAIFEVRGGWGSNRILPYLNYATIKQHPKILIGFSDITSLLLAITSKTGLVTFHGTMGVETWPEYTVNYMKQVLFDATAVTFANPVMPVDTKTDVIQTDDRITTIRGGTAEGILFGGNLTTLISMLSSGYLPNWQGAILFVEDVDEDYYKIDRMMNQLQMAGVLGQISGFIFGKCVDCSAGKNSTTSPVLGSENLEQILDHYIKPLGIPAWSGAMIGHLPQMLTLPEGMKVRIDADKGTITMLQPAVKETKPLPMCENKEVSSKPVISNL